jgi:hypothetical protein
MDQIQDFDHLRGLFLVYTLQNQTVGRL